MNATALKIAPPPCQSCDGRGGWLETVRCSGEAVDADQREVYCWACNGTGETDPECPFCDAPVDETGFCGACREQVA